MYSVKTLERNEFGSSIIDSIITALHESSVREKDHSIHVSELCQEFGRALNLSEVDIRKLKEAGYLHDIGKIVADPKLLDKNFEKDSKEWDEMKKHPIVGYRILNSFDDTADLAELVLSHHEQWDGSGYPKGLKGEEIPLLARIIALAESYDRMINDSENTKAMSEADAIRLIEEKAGEQFDPQPVEVFIKLVEADN
jgi:putative nucleotidyltransferase with HDIG domain